MTEEEIKEYKHLVAFSGSPDGAANFIDWLNKKMFAYRTLEGNDVCGPWIPDLTKKESELLDQIYREFHEGSYISSLPISGGQIAYQIFDQIKHKVYH